VESGVKLRRGVHLGGTGDEICEGRARYLRRVKGRLRTYWEDERIRFYISLWDAHISSLIFIYLFTRNLTVRTRRAARDGSLTARATGRHSHILFSLLAVLSNARLSPSHATSQPQLFSHYIHIYLRSHQINTLTFHPRPLSVSFYVFW